MVTMRQAYRKVRSTIVSRRKAPHPRIGTTRGVDGCTDTAATRQSAGIQRRDQLGPVNATRCAAPVHFAAINATVVSSMRLLKPHSLSYQESTFTRLPLVTRVCGASNTELWLSWLKSLDTSGSLL